jgi:hypothetical protein
MEIIFWSSVALFLIAAISVAAMVAKHNRIDKDEDPVPDDLPARYDDVQHCERPYYEYFN